MDRRGQEEGGRLKTGGLKTGKNVWTPFMNDPVWKFIIKNPCSSFSRLITIAVSFSLILRCNFKNFSANDFFNDDVSRRAQFGYSFSMEKRLQ